MSAEPLTGRLNYLNEGDITRKRRGSWVRNLMVHNLRYFSLKRISVSPKDDEVSLVMKHFLAKRYEKRIGTVTPTKETMAESFADNHCMKSSLQ